MDQLLNIENCKLKIKLCNLELLGLLLPVQNYKLGLQGIGVGQILYKLLVRFEGGCDLWLGR